MIDNLVSVIIPVYNRETLVVETIDSVLRQSYSDYEIIVVDDGSTDQTVHQVLKVAEAHSQVRLLEQKNGGPGMARQTGLDVAVGEFIQFLDSDDVLLENKFRSQVTALQEHPDAVAAYGKTERLPLGHDRTFKAWKRTGIESKFMFPEFLMQRWWGTSTPLYRRECLDKIGPWLALINEEDWEYDCRVASLGRPIVYIDEFVSIQRQHDDHLSDEGAVDPRKLAHRAMARHAIYASAIRCSSQIGQSYFNHFSKSAFLLARQCASQNLSQHSSELIELSIRAGNYMPYKQKVFVLIARLCGWRFAARIANTIDKVINS